MIKKCAVLFGLLFLPAFAFSQEEPAIAVVDFTSAVNTRLINKLPDLIVDRLVNAGYVVVERDKFSSAIDEMSAGQSGLLDSSTAANIGNMMGAKLIVTGNILNHSSSKKSAMVYGSRVTKITQTLEARMEVLDVERGTKIFSKTAEETSVNSVSGFADTGTATDVGDAVARKLVNAMLGSKSVKDAVKVLSGEQETVTVTIASTPEGADVEIDGVFLGQAGNLFDLAPGLHTITVSYPDHEPWEKQVMVKEGMSFNARLGKSN